jgi:hypothetical protein
LGVHPECLALGNRNSQVDGFVDDVCGALADSLGTAIAKIGKLNLKCRSAIWLTPLRSIMGMMQEFRDFAMKGDLVHTTTSRAFDSAEMDEVIGLLSTK